MDVGQIGMRHETGCPDCDKADKLPKSGHKTNLPTYLQ